MVLTDAGALPQAQGSSGNRRKLLHLVMEPSNSLLGSFSHVYKSFCLHTPAGARDFSQSVPCKEISALSAKRWFKARNWQRSADLRTCELAAAKRRFKSGQTMVQVQPDRGVAQPGSTRLPALNALLVLTTSPKKQQLEESAFRSGKTPAPLIEGVLTQF